MPKIEGFKKVRQALKQKVTESKKKDDVSVTVGFSQNYAAWVHEKKARHEKPGQWKFLSTPARELADELGNRARRIREKTGSTKKALLDAGLRLQREAQQITPVDTGALKASAFTALTEDEDRAAAIAWFKSEVVRAKELAKREARKK